MKQKREYRIAWRRFDRVALEQLAHTFVEERDVAHHAGEHAILRFQISCDDGTTYESDVGDLVAEGSEAIMKNPIAVSFELDIYAGKMGLDRVKGLSLELRHG